MIADYFTKPLLGNFFTYLRDIIMGITPYPAKERVGNEVCPGMECEKFNPSTADTGSIYAGEKDTTDDATQA